MSTTFANTIDGNDIYAARAVADKDGNQLDTTYTKASTLATVATSGDYTDLSNTPTIRNVPASTSSDATKVLTVDSNGDAGWAAPAGMFLAEYGTTTYQEVLDAYEANKIVYCRVPGSSASYKKMAFLEFVNRNTSTPSNSNFEFQYYRSVSSHTASQQGDQVEIYKVAYNNTWTTTIREAASKVVAGTHMSQSYSSGTLTLNATWPTVDQTFDSTSTNAQSGTAVAGALATKEDAFTVGTGLEMDTTGGTNTLQVEAPVDIVAGPGIAIDNPDGNTLRVSNSNSEVVLWDGNGTAASSCVLSEHPSNFERLILYVGESAYKDCHSCPGSNGNIRIASVSGGTNSWLSFYFIKRTNLTLEVIGDKRLNFGAIDSTTASYTVTIGNKAIIWKVVGVNRIANN